MLSKQNRLQKNREFQRVFKAGRPANTINLTVRAAKNMTKDGKIRFGFVVSNKIEKRATRRNALKRQFREIAGALICEIKPGYDVVVVVRKDFNFPYKQEEIRAQFEEGVRKASLFKN